MYHGDANAAPDQHDWWDDADVSGLVDPQALGHFLHNCDFLLEDLDFEGDNDQTIPWHPAH